MSKPPRPAKKIWRFIPRVPRTRISFATCASCCPRPLVGNVTGSAGAPASAAFISWADRRESLSTPSAAVTSFSPVSKVSSRCSDATRATIAELEPKLRSPDVAALETLTGPVRVPDRKSAFPLLTVIPGVRVPVLSALITSLTRPAHPVSPPFGSELCHCCVWSECDWRLRGSATLFSVAFVVGCTSVPTLNTGAATFWL